MKAIRNSLHWDRSTMKLLLLGASIVAMLVGGTASNHWDGLHFLP